MSYLGQLTSSFSLANVNCNRMIHTEAGGIQALGISQFMGALRGLFGFGNLNLLKLIALVCLVLLV